MKRPFLYIAVSFSLGISAATVFKIPFISAFLLSIVFIALAVFYSKKVIASHISLYLAVLFLGIFAYRNANILPANHISNYTPEGEKKIFLKGLIIDDPIIGDTFYRAKMTAFLLKAEAIKENTAWRRVSGLTKVTVYPVRNSISNGVYGGKKEFGYGDEVLLEGLLSRPNSLKNPGLFDYSKYLANKRIHSVITVKDNFLIERIGPDRSNTVKTAVYKLRGKIEKAIDGYFHQPYSGFLKAILVGDRSGLKKKINDDFVKTGTVHIIAVSGLHVGLIASIFLFIFGILRLPRKINLLVTAAVVVFYSMLTGSNPPIMRAAIIFIIYVLSYLLEREADTLNSLSIAALAILLFDPNGLFDPSFQLSFLSILGTIVIVPKIDEIFGICGIRRDSVIDKAKFYILKSVSVSIAAWAAVWPLVSLYFNITSPIAVIANLIIIPALFLVMVLSFVFLLSCIVSSVFAAYLALLLKIILFAIFAMNKTLADLPFSYFRTPAPSAAFFIFYYGALIYWLMPPKALNRSRYALAIALLLFNIFVWKDNINFGKKPVRVTFLDVGQGDAALVEFPEKGTLLIDAGSGGEEEKFDVGRSVVAPYIWNQGIRRIGAVMVTHFHEDHLGGILYILKNFEVGCVIDSGTRPSQGNALYEEYRKIINQRNIRRIIVREGDMLKVSGGADIYILNPKKEDNIVDSNDNSIVAKFIYKNSSILFCGDITSKAMTDLIGYDGFLKSDIMKVPHHGGLLGDEREVKNFMEKVSPKIAIISVGRKNRFNAPSEKTLNIITSLNSISYETKKIGAIKVDLK